MSKMIEVSKEVEMVTQEGHPVNIKFTQYIEGFIRLGKEIKISPKANASINKAGYKAEYFVDTVSVCIGIGKDHTAELIMTKDAWEALKSGEKVKVETTEEHKQKFG